MAAGDAGSPKRYYSAIAIQTTITASLSAQSQGSSNSSFIVASNSGFPSTYPFTLIVEPDTSKEEVVTVVAGTGTTYTVTRGQDGTAAPSHSAGATVRHGVSGRDFTDLQNHIVARGYDSDAAILGNAGQTNVHGIGSGDGDIVGTTKTQSLTNKTSITGLVSSGLGSTSATPKSYVDAILGSATAAATSATNAATSATSAATSATSAAASATAAATSASSASTSASSALTYASSASTSATSASASASAASTSATSAANSASAAATSASSAATSATSAAASSSSATVSASSAGTSATSAAASATAAATSASSAATSASSAAASTSAAATSAASAATSASAAATSASSASTSASSASTYATSAANSASAAATSATSAAASATAAATSATSAATSATSSAASFTSMDQKYLGAKSTAPTLDNQGGALVTGATYWNSTGSQMYAWSGSAWIAVTTTGAVTTVNGTAGRISSTGTSTVTLDLSTTAVSAGTYSPASITVDAYGRITSASTAAVSTDPNPQIFMLMGA